MKTRTFKTLILASAFIGLTATAEAKGELDQCLEGHESCIATCMDKETLGSKSACVAQCAVSEAQCAGEIGLKTGEPYILDKIEEMEGLIEKFLKDFMPGYRSTPEPDEEKPEATNT
ncbi:hypothetical protein [Terasakiella pusilla]|uniref:hypothetical protein n=1 Tax=Terasakiella pusilla TaxID=64973 RepID=UPI00048D06F7|nr:hypothetical protein [Terasakiella pusilla]